jgi:hypothetical protein
MTKPRTIAIIQRPMKPGEKTELRLIPGGMATWHHKNQCRVQVIQDLPSSCVWDVQIIEDDTYRVMSAPAEIPQASEHPIRVMTGVLEVQPLEIGQFLFSKRHIPPQLTAIVYDSNHEQLTEKKWLQAAWKELWRLAKEHQWAAVLTPLLGAKFGGLAHGDVVSAFCGSLESHAALDIWLWTPPHYVGELVEALQRD